MGIAIMYKIKTENIPMTPGIMSVVLITHRIGSCSDGLHPNQTARSSSITASVCQQQALLGEQLLREHQPRPYVPGRSACMGDHTRSHRVDHTHNNTACVP
jgi:hypothetical protein